MSHQSGPSLFQTLFESALQDYEIQTGIPLPNHPLAQQLQNCQSVESVTALLQEQAQAFNKFPESDKIFKSLKGVVSALSGVSAITAFGQAFSTPFPPADAIHTGLGILLAAFKGVTSDLDALADLLETVEHFLKRLNIYTKVLPTPAMTEIVVKIMVELLSTLALATKQIRQGRPKKFVKKLFGENEVDAILQRLDRLTQDEARTTAAQTLEVVYGLLQNMRVVIDDGKASADSVRGTLELMQEITSEMNKSKRDKLQDDVRSWLSPPNPWKNHNLARGSQHTGTAAWFVEGSTLPEWKSSGPRSLLWIHGKPGAGKSVLCSTIIDNVDTMRKSGLASLACFYCDFREDEKRDLHGLLSSVLVQLCHQSDSYCQILSRFYSEHANGTKDPSDDELERCFRDILMVPGHAPVYLIVDGLDECSNTSAMPSPREKVLILLKDLMDSQLPNLRICVTSRPEIDIKAVLEPLTFRSVSLHDESGQLEDIDNYIKSVVNTDPNMRRWKAADKELVIDMLIKKSDGMFRWVYCQIVYLRLCLPGSIRHALDELPETLDETYEHALRNISKANWEFAYRLLQCVAVAFRPLRVTELAEILSFEFKKGPIPKFHEDWQPGDSVEAVLSTTSSLLAKVDVEGSPVIQFSHFSVKEYLTSSRLAETNDTISGRYHISQTLAHTLAARACLGILLHLDKTVVIRNNLEKYPLAEYAAEYWVGHARFEGVSEYVEDGMKRLFDPNKGHLAIWLWIHDPLLPPWEQTRRAATPSWTPASRAETPAGNSTEQAEPALKPKGSSLHYAALCGLQVVVKFLIIQHSQDVHSLCSNDKLSPLHLASQRGHRDVALILLEHGADLTAQTKDGSTPLHAASNVEVARLLLEHGADATAQTKDGSTPLHVASDVEVARLLLEHGADPTARTKDGSMPLHRTWNVEVARLLLEHGADATARTKDGSTPLHWTWNVELARLLLEHGADAIARTKDGLTPLHSTHNVEVARLLLEHGADATAQTKDGSMPLHWTQDVEVARLLLELGADATAQTKDGSTPLHRTCDAEVARLLIEHGADATAQTENGSTPIHAALNVEVARVLLEHGADATAQTKDDLTPLHQTSNVEVARLLLELGADATAQTKDGSTPLHAALNVEVARLLLEHGADATAQTKDGLTPLHQASNVEVARLLLQHGADATAQTKDGTTPIHQAWNAEVVRLLLEHGADATARTKDGLTPLHAASDVEVAHLLLQYGANATARTNDGSTPLHRTWNVEVARLLIDHGADATAQTKDGSIPLHWTSNVEVARLLLEHGADATAQTKDGSMLLHWTQNVEVARLLLEHGADATARTKNGSTPLHWKWNVEVACLLLEHGADPRSQANNGLTPLHSSSSGEVASFLLENGADATARTNDGSTPLHMASQQGYKDVVRLLLEHGADVTTQTKNGSTPVHLAVRFGHANIVRSFLECGGDVTFWRKDGSTLLHLASRWGHLEVTCLLFEHGVDAMAVNKHGWSALHLASRWGHVEVARFLLDHGADVTGENDYGSTPSLLASRAGHSEVARLLVERGADATGMEEKVATPWEVELHQQDLEVTCVPEHNSIRQRRTGTVIFVAMVIVWRIWIFLASFSAFMGGTDTRVSLSQF